MSLPASSSPFICREVSHRASASSLPFFSFSLILVHLCVCVWWLMSCHMKGPSFELRQRPFWRRGQGEMRFECRYFSCFDDPRHSSGQLRYDRSLVLMSPAGPGHSLVHVALEQDVDLGPQEKGFPKTGGYLAFALHLIFQRFSRSQCIYFVNAFILIIWRLLWLFLLLCKPVFVVFVADTRIMTINHLFLFFAVAVFVNRRRFPMLQEDSNFGCHCEALFTTSSAAGILTEWGSQHEKSSLQ